MFTDIAQESQHIHAAEPVIVIGRDGGVFRHQSRDRGMGQPVWYCYLLLNGLFGVQFTLGGTKLGSPIEYGRAAYQRNRFCPACWKRFRA